MASQTINVVHRITVEDVLDAEGNRKTVVRPPEGMHLHEAQGLLTQAILELDREYRG
ncbi:hypothetical protein [Aeromicrobium sp. HA]|uniref:hypothetical protein n=1 Tax=Aeromicrobium sp. HA TaxID=3009077 RepID=UPI0022AF7A93|nr:hypothetical protein [Aeromicrobium sp. HA]